MKNLLFIFTFIALSKISFSQDQRNGTQQIVSASGGHLHGTLLMPADSNKKMPVVLLIAGSGPTDRDGNQAQLKNNSLKMLAEAFQDAGIASFRYDKRGVGASSDFQIDESKLTFDDFVNDAVACLQFLKSKNKFSEIIVAGHSEGALIGLLAAKRAGADKYISICGAGRSIDLVLKEQLARQPDTIRHQCYVIIDSLKEGHTVKNVNPLLFSLFRPSVQPFMISWMNYNPVEEIKSLQIPVAIVEGDQDLQISEEDAKALKAAYPSASYFFIHGMNHVLKAPITSQQENIDAYTNPNHDLSKELVSDITAFINAR